MGMLMSRHRKRHQKEVVKVPEAVEVPVVVEVPVEPVAEPDEKKPKKSKSV